MNIASKFKAEAASLGLCGQWMNEWEPHDDVRDLASRYVDGISFCLLHDWPSLDAIRNVYEADRLAMNDCGVYIDERLDLTLPDSRDYVLRGECTGNVLFRGIGISYVYVMDNCDVDITASGFSTVFVKTVGRNVRCRCKSEGNGRIKVREFKKEDIETSF